MLICVAVFFFNPVKRLDVTSFTACVKDLQLYDERHDPLTVYYIAFGGEIELYITNGVFSTCRPSIFDRVVYLTGFLSHKLALDAYDGHYK